MADERGILVVISGFSGVGKGTLMQELIRRYDNYALSISATTRAARPGEEHGREYFFVSMEEFDQMIAQDELIEYAKYVSNYYGTPRRYVEEKLNEGKDVILEIEIRGALKIKSRYPQALLIFVAPPSAGELHRRLLKRGTESQEVIDSRMRRAVEESEGIFNYDYIVVNDDLDRCTEELHSLIQREYNSVHRKREFIKQIQTELKEYWKGDTH